MGKLQPVYMHEKKQTDKISLNLTLDVSSQKSLVKKATIILRVSDLLLAFPTGNTHDVGF